MDIRKLVAALLAGWVMMMAVFMPVKAAVTFPTQQAVGYYPDVTPYTLNREYQCTFGGTDQTMFADMSYGQSTHELTIVAVLYTENVSTHDENIIIRRVTGYSSTGFSESIVSSDYAAGWRFTCGDARYRIRTVDVATLSVN